jgi:HD-like signal output (HDOD) protein
MSHIDKIIEPNFTQDAATDPAKWAVVEGAWLDGVCATTTEPGTARLRLERAMEKLRDHARTAQDRMFAGALLEVLQAHDLRLPDFPETAQKLDRQLATLDPNYSQVMHIIESDPALVGHIWQIARSARFPKPPTSLSMAVSRVGMVEIWRISVQMALEAIRIQPGPFKTQADGIRLHGVLVADVTAALAKQRQGTEFLAGLLHDVGALVILEAAARTDPDPQTVARVMAEHHSAFGMLVADAWKLGPEAIEAIGFHHNPSAVGAGLMDLPRLVAIADIAVSGALDHRRARQSFPEVAIQEMALGQMEPTRPLVLADRSIDRMESEGLDVLGVAL